MYIVLVPKDLRLSGSLGFSRLGVGAYVQL